MADKTPNLGLPLISENMTANVPRDMNALAQAIDESVGDISIPDASLTVAGKVKLSNKTDGISESVAATEKAVKSAYDRGSSGVTAAQAAQAIINNRDGYGTTTNSGNTYAVTLTPAPTSYVDGLRITIKINAANTGAVTINVNGLGAKSVLKSNGSAMTANGLRANSVYSLVYNGTNFILQGEGGGDPIPGSQSYNQPGSFTFVVPDGISRLIVDMWGAGGGGGGGAIGAGQGSGGGGGAGAYLSLSLPVIPGQSIPIVVGSGGYGGGTDSNGASGGLSKVGNYIAYGGGGGAAGASVTGGRGGGYATATANGTVGLPGLSPNSNLTLNDSTIQRVGYMGGNGSQGNNYAEGGGGGASASDTGTHVNGSGNGYTGGTALAGFYYAGGYGGSGAYRANSSGSGGVGGGGGGGISGSGNNSYGSSTGGSPGGNGLVILKW
ncbi:hypothetical protein B2I21_07520 [Chryseobacterium mucoviscidosis]|nr:hypothetical protein B2I21_07520 [Chryseobacterium mucoviscidosis]